MVELHCCGDILPSDRLYTLGIGVRSRFEQSENDFFACLDTFDADKNIIRFGNLESPLISSETFPGTKPFAGHPEFSSILNTAGFDVLSIANNHIGEFSNSGFKHTVLSLKNDGIEPIGISDQQSGSNTAIIEKFDLKVGFAAFSSIHLNQKEKNYAALNKQNIQKAIISLKDQGSDVIVLSFHWGDEYIHIPSWDQIQIGRYAIDAGADVIVGHHSHTIQPVEEYKKGLIFYGLGNFLFDMLWSQKVRTGLYPVINLSYKGVENYQLHQVIAGDNYIPKIVCQDSWLKKRLLDSRNKMNKLTRKGETTYKRNYRNSVFMNRFFARIGMKKQLLKQWKLLPGESKRKILNHISSNIIRY